MEVNPVSLPPLGYTWISQIAVHDTTVICPEFIADTPFDVLYEECLVRLETTRKKSGIPNRSRPQCSDRLKANVIESYKKSLGLKGCKHAIGIRADEPSRKSKWAQDTYNIVYPLSDWFEADKIDVNDFWEEQPFTLNLEPHEGNCSTCWKKSDNPWAIRTSW